MSCRDPAACGIKNTEKALCPKRQRAFSVCKNTESKKAAGRSCQEPDGMGITISR
jgi:hypothetical protein